MSELRDKVIAIIKSFTPSDERADRILALPEIAEALKLLDNSRQSHASTGHIIASE